MSTAQIELPPNLIDLFTGTADTRCAKGGRGSAKTRSFAKMTAVRAYMWSMEGREGIVVCGRQYMNSLDESSMEEVKAAIRSEPWLLNHFELGEKYIRTKDGRIKYAFAGLDRNIASIKSKARILLCWVDEAEEVIEESWQTLIPTIREEESELWVTWNPRRASSATNKRFSKATDPNTKLVTVNWRDNPWFPERLNRERLKDQEDRPDSYEHVWEGQFLTVMQGSYYASAITLARQENRIGRVAADPLMQVRLFVDIGGTGAKADAFTIWAAQFIGKEIRVINYYETVGQPLSAHLVWLREQKYTQAQIWLPHDGDTQDRVIDVSYRSALEQAGYTVNVVKNQGRGAAKARIEEARRLFPSIWFNEETTKAGIEALGWYHEKRDDKRDIGLGPDHDWSSHAADSFGLMAICHVAQRRPVREEELYPEWVG